MDLFQLLTCLIIMVVCHCNPIENDIGRLVETSDWMWNLNTYPHPKENFEKCRQSAASTLCDPDGLLTKEEANNLKELIERLQNKSPCLCKEDCVEDAHSKGLIVGVALMETVATSFSLKDPRGFHNFSMDLRKKWNLGSCGNDIFIAVMKETKVGSIVTGDAVKDFLPEEVIGDIFEACKGHLETDHYYQGLESIINSLYDELNTNLLKAPRMNEDDESSTGNVGLTVGLVVGMACLCGLVVAGFIIVRKQKRNNRNSFMYDGANGRQGSRNSANREIISPIVKQHVVFPDAIYQPCSVEDSRKSLQTDNQAGSDEEEEHENSDEFYLHSLEENPAYISADMLRSQKALSVVKENPEQDTKEPPVGVHYSNNPYRNSSHRDESNKDVPV